MIKKRKDLAQPMELSRRILEVVPPVIRQIRKEMRELASSELTVPQFRILAFLAKSPASNSELAVNIGVSLAAMTRMVDCLVRRGLVTREQAKTGDRRQVQVKITRKGGSHFETVKRETQQRLHRRLSGLSEGEKQELETGLLILERIFA